MTSGLQPKPTIVTGASGLIGRGVIDELRRRGRRAIAVARRDLAPLPGVEVLRVNDYRELLIPDGAVVIHLAGQSNIAIANRAGQAHVNEELALAEHMCGQGAGRIVYGSSGQVYGATAPAAHVPAETVTATMPYTQAKLAVENLVCSSGGIAVRLANVYGPGMSSTLISDILSQIPGTGPLRIRDARPRRDYLWIADAARGLVDMAFGEPQGIYNLANGQVHSAGEVARLALSVAEQTDRSIEVTKTEGVDSVIALNIEDTVSAFGWEPRTTLAQGLRLLLSDNDNDRKPSDA